VPAYIADPDHDPRTLGQRAVCAMPLTPILAITGPICLVIGLGCLAGRFEAFSNADLGVLGR
jgi:hypothetical protein